MHGLVKDKKPVLSSEGRVHPIITLRFSCGSWLPRPSYPSVQLYLVITASRPTKMFVLTICLYWAGQFKNKYVARGQSNVNWLGSDLRSWCLPAKNIFFDALLTQRKPQFTCPSRMKLNDYQQRYSDQVYFEWTSTYPVYLFFDNNKYGFHGYRNAFLQNAWCFLWLLWVSAMLHVKQQFCRTMCYERWIRLYLHFH